MSDNEKLIVPVLQCEKSALTYAFNQHINQQHEQAFVINDIGIVERQFERWCRNLPEVKPFYAVKCNPDEILLTTLAGLNAGFDCASADEIRRVLKIGVKPGDIIFANPVKSITDLRFAAQVGVNKVTFDSEAELHKIHKHFPKAELVLRILPDDSGSLMRFGSKFGAHPSSFEALLKIAKQLGLNIIGTSFHIGSGCFDPNKYLDAIVLARSVFDIADSLDLPPFKFLDIGGGFPGNPAMNQTTVSTAGGIPSFEEFSHVIRCALDYYFPEATGVQFAAEPGRYMATAWSTLFTLIQGKRIEIPDILSDGQQSFLYYLNDGVYGSFNSIMFDHAQPLPIPAYRLLPDLGYEPGADTLYAYSKVGLTVTGAENQDPRKQPRNLTSPLAFDIELSLMHLTQATFFGPTCDSMDIIVRNFPLEEMHLGDWIAFKDMGAYTSAAATTFNGMPKALVYYVRSMAATTVENVLITHEKLPSYA